MDVLLRAELVAELAVIEKELQSEDLTWEQTLELKDASHNIRMKLNGVKPNHTQIDCIGCGS
tara:strand:- start:1814 stop:1999 length:186 start_codon:yes stop_codon:yes gene_type:complete